VAAGWTDNAANSPSEPLDGELTPEGSLFIQLRPSVLFSFESPRTVHVSSLNLELIGYQVDNPPATYNVTFAHNSLFSISQTTELALIGTMNTGRVSAILGEAGGELPQALPGGGSTFIGGSVADVLRWQ